MSQAVQIRDEIEFSVFGRKIAAKCWGDPTGAPTLMLHGWLDNANSFDELAPLLPELNLVALDFAGHGLSDHRAAGCHYYQLDDVQDVLGVADQLGWATFGLIGHSMGAQVSSEIACLFPQRVARAVMIDGFLATGGVSAAERIEQARDGVARMLSTAPITPRVFADVAAMAQRVTEATDQSYNAALTLVQRGHKVVEGGVTWRTDPRIRFPTPLRYSREFMDELIALCEVPSLLLVAEQGDEWYRGEVSDAERLHPQLTLQRMQGPHHVHLEQAHVAEVARRIRGFLGLG